MRIHINEEPTDFGGATVADLAAQLGLPGAGVAVARGNAIIPRAQWAETNIDENDKLTIIKAVCGG